MCVCTMYIVQQVPNFISETNLQDPLLYVELGIITNGSVPRGINLHWLEDNKYYFALQMVLCLLNYLIFFLFLFQTHNLFLLGIAKTGPPPMALLTVIFEEFMSSSGTNCYARKSIVSQKCIDQKTTNIILPLQRVLCLLKCLIGYFCFCFIHITISYQASVTSVMNF